MTTSLYDILDEFRATFPGNVERGAAFERLIQAYLRADPMYARFGHVWLWQDWPGRQGQSDSGIDLVADDGAGQVVAIQCKFYDPAHTLQKSDIDSFFTRSGKRPFTERLIVSTTEKWSTHAEQALEDQQIPVARIGLADLEASGVDWSSFSLAKPEGPLKLAEHKKIRPHQQAALGDVLDGFAGQDRGRLIMACGTGKTFTALKIAERVAADSAEAGGSGVQVLVLVPSIALVNQTLREWTREASVSLRSFAVCSDTKVGKHSEDVSVHDLAFPATTDTAILVKQVAESDAEVDLTVIFSTYQSIEVVAKAQQAGLGEFDLVICDEAHRTTGVTLADGDESAFVRVHDNDFITAKKRLYMTATPRIFTDDTKAKAADADAVLCSMDDEAIYGPEFHRLGFGQAVEAGLLTDYRVLVLNVDQDHIAKSLQAQLADDNNELSLDDAARIVGCWNGLAKRSGTLIVGDGFGADTAPMRRAVAFSRTIKASKSIAAKFDDVIGAYVDEHSDGLACEVHHVDGTMNALVRGRELDWLRAEPGENTCRILSNARCLSEGVDVPDLDAVLFLNPRNSVVDVVQSVGRVMRRAPGKRYGYIILPVAIPADLKPEVALRDNKRYQVVWQVLQALRAHDDRFNAMVNQIELNKRDPKQLNVIGVPGAEPTDNGTEGAPAAPGAPTGETGSEATGAGETNGSATQQVIPFPVAEWRDAIYARIVAKVGERTYWEQWADDIRLIAERHVARIKAAVGEPGSAKAEAFDRFVAELQANLNPGIDRDDATDMLAQHLITKPVFDALFGDYEFSEHNPVSLTMQAMLDELDDQALSSEAETLESFYASVRKRAEGIDNHAARQVVITELYERFFKLALPKTADALGIVYTPVEIVDFILRAVDQALRVHLDTTLSTEGVHVLDPFTGTGTFIVRLLDSGLISPADLARKYASELHANEILLLAYYIAAVNIEATYHQLTPDGDYAPFEGIVLTDTFQLAETGDQQSLAGDLFPENHERLTRQRDADIRVIVGNPPYSAGQTSQNDANQNQEYPNLDKRIELTYAKGTSATSARTLYDSYIRAIRWATDRIGDTGVVAYVSNGGWIDSNSADGLRKALADEYDHIYVYNLRGNQRTAGEQSRREGGKVFGGGSRATVAITLLIRTSAEKPCTIRYADIGDYLTREQKLDIVADRSLDTIEWATITPNAAGDWLNQRSDDFADFTPLGHKARKGEPQSATVTDVYSLGVATGKDAWCWNFDPAQTSHNIGRMIATYNDELDRFTAQAKGLTGKARRALVDEVVTNDPHQISWTRALKDNVAKGRRLDFEACRIVVGSYRPFTKQHLYFDRDLIEMVYKQPRIFPGGHGPNIGFYLTAAGSDKPFAALMTDHVPDLAMWGSSGGQYFPRWRYPGTPTSTADGMFDAESTEWVDNISADTLADYQATYGDHVTADDIFYAVYGLLHSPEYRQRYAADLHKMLPRIPKVTDFAGFVDAGRRLADLHVGYEIVDPYPLEDPSLDHPKWAGNGGLRVEKMRFAKHGKAIDKSSIVVNSHLTLSGIPDDAHRYLLGSRSAIEWIIDRYQVKTDKASGIVNDPNTWCDQVGEPRYIVDLLKRIVTVSVETMKIVDALPPLHIIE